ncbi:MmgE/PrpD family protein [Chelativorans xinjiangense]|uniref:MmgE/PrpD family protein n=1 Tax=Chelativorans xinjiangense TaxID=2681485 RepID=UPI00135BE454|nr:MmgE/PrpD family protein [Chelativorans xinjiangense]
MPYIAETLASFAAETSKQDIPEAAWSAAERSLLDTLAAIIGGVNTQNASDARRASLEVFGPGSFSCWFGKADKMHFLGALFSNCAAASALDVDDGHRGAAGHPGAAIIPAVLMEAEHRPVSGEDLLAAVIIGYDVALRIGEARRLHEEISFASGIWTCYGVAAALGRLRGLSAGQIAHAMAIAGAEAPQNLPQGACRASSVKGSSPWSTVTATVAVARTAAGATGSIDLLDRGDAYQVAAIPKGLAERWPITEAYFKPYASCRYTHPVIDAILQIKRGMGPEPASIQSLHVEIFPEASKLPNSVAPTSLEDAQFSLPYCAALAAVRDAAAFRPLKPDSLRDQQVLKLAEQISIDYSKEFAGAFPQRTPARVTIVSRDNPSSVYVDPPLGDPHKPLGDDDLIRKLVDFGNGVAPEEHLFRVASKCLTLKGMGHLPFDARLLRL